MRTFQKSIAQSQTGPVPILGPAPALAIALCGAGVGAALFEMPPNGVGADPYGVGAANGGGADEEYGVGAPIIPGVCACPCGVGAPNPPGAAGVGAEPPNGVGALNDAGVGAEYGLAADCCAYGFGGNC